MAKGAHLFQQYYEPGLVKEGVENVALRTYTHIQGLATDDPANSTEIIFSPRKEVDRRLDEIHALYGKNRGIAITSIVTAHLRQRYLFLLDCIIQNSERNEAEMIAVLRASFDILPVLSDAMLLATRSSYHIVGFEPLTENEWTRSMAQAILLQTALGNPIVDARYVGHSLERGYGSLRISDYMGKPAPYFVCYL